VNPTIPLIIPYSSLNIAVKTYNLADSKSTPQLCIISDLFTATNNHQADILILNFKRPGITFSSPALYNCKFSLFLSCITKKYIKLLILHCSFIIFNSHCLIYAIYFKHHTSEKLGVGADQSV
jgi:hypothetical protein